MDKVNLRVLLKEPRGFIRLLQIFFSVLAWSTTAGFSTTTILTVNCPDIATWPVEYKVDYPFDLRQTEISAPANCTDDTNLLTEKFPIDFSSTAMLYVLVCFLSFVYAIGVAVYYCLFSSKYETDPLAPMVDLSLTILLTFFWLAITFTWALNVSDIKHYTHPHYFKDHLSVCQDVEANCQPSHPGKWSSLTVSIVCGFICCVLWAGSTWFVFKESSLHKKQSYQTNSNQPPQQAGI